MQLKVVRSFRLGIVLTIALACSCAPAWQRAVRAADPVKPKVDDLSALLAESVQKHKLPGMAAAIVEGGRITAIGAAGVRCRGHQERITTDDLFHIGSNTKAMTATLIALFVEEGKLRWDSTPVEVFAKRGVKDIDPAWKRVTLEELLTHRAGVRPNPDDQTLVSVLAQSPREQRFRVSRAVLHTPPQQDPGKSFLYSNTGYIIAGAMAEIVGDESWENLMVKRVFKPLGMDHAGFGPPGVPLKSAKHSGSPSIDQPWGHLPTGEAVKPGPDADNPPCFGPAGRVHLTLGDWARFATLHLSVGPGARGEVRGAGSQSLLPSTALIRMHTPVDGALERNGKSYAGYAMGWGVRAIPGSRGVELIHNGSNSLWYATISLDMSANRAILIAINQAGDGARKASVEVKSALAKRASRSGGPQN